MERNAIKNQNDLVIPKLIQYLFKCKDISKFEIMNINVKHSQVEFVLVNKESLVSYFRKVIFDLNTDKLIYTSEPLSVSAFEAMFDKIS